MLALLVTAEIAIAASWSLSSSLESLSSCAPRVTLVVRLDRALIESEPVALTIELLSNVTDALEMAITPPTLNWPSRKSVAEIVTLVVAEAESKMLLPEMPPPLVWIAADGIASDWMDVPLGPTARLGPDAVIVDTRCGDRGGGPGEQREGLGGRSPDRG